MDELVRHCLRELSFDGDLGCDVSRLRDFIVDFYAHPTASAGAGVGQNVDDAFCAFVWSVIVQQPGVRVGTVPEGASTEVFIAPQASAIRKAKAKGGEPAEEPAPVAALDVVEDATIRPLEDLKKQYGDRLRIAADPETIFVALTGSHIRPSKLTPMIYTGLQLVTRGREQGVSVLDLGRKSGYDQKTCFYIIKQLVELDYIVKLRRPGISTNLCVHKYFYERSPIWKQVVDEEKKAVSEEQAEDNEVDSDDAIDEDETKPLEPVHFDPIDSRHLSSMPLLKSRLTKLLKSCPHNMHTSSNIMVKIGFANPTRTDRRFFRTRLRELMEQGVIEKVQVPHADRQRFPGRKVPCIRLISEDENSQVQGEVVPIDDEDLEADAGDYTGMKANVSLHRQIIDLLAESGTKGMTLNEISAALGDFDRRTIDLLLNRLEKDPPPAHLADLGIAQLAETHGRERRYKYYTVAHYLALADRERFEDRRYRDTDMSAVGGFRVVCADAFYALGEELAQHVNTLVLSKRDGVSTTAKGKKRVNPILPDGSIKKGRPRKNPEPVDGSASAAPKQSKKRKRESAENGEDGGTGDTPLAKKKRGRPPKKAMAQAPAKDGEPAQGADGDNTPVAPSTVKRKRGRPKKAAESDGQGEATAAGPSSQPPAPKRRGRPPKKSLPAPAEDVFGPVSLEGDLAAATNAEEATEPVEVLPDVEAAPSSPLSSPTGSSLRASSPTPVSRAVGDKQFGAAQVSSAALSLDQTQVRAQDPDSSGRRRSTRTPKVRIRGESLSPARNARQLRTSQASTEGGQTGARRVEDTQDASATTVEASVSVEPPAQVSPQPQAQSSTIPSKNHGVSVYDDIPIDPALQAESMSLLAAQGHHLIRMTPEPDVLHVDESVSQGPSKKRDVPEAPSDQPQAKRTKSTQAEGSRYRSKANISHSRRENELLRLLNEAGGIMNTSCKEFYEAHAALVEVITKEGEVASTRPGARIDKRTLEATLSSLEAKGKIKVITTLVPNPTGSTRPIRVMYLPDTLQDKLQAFLAELSETTQPVYLPSLKTLEEPLAYGGARVKTSARSRGFTSLRQSSNQNELEADASELFQRDDQTIRDTLLTEKNTVAQLYGYIVGKAARARALHMLTADIFENGSSSSQLVSSNSRIISFAFYYTDISVSAFCSFVAVSQPFDELGNLLQTPEGQATPVRELPESVRTALAPSHSKARARILSLLDMLRVLGLAIPLVPSESPTPAITCTSNSEHPSTFDIAPPGPYTPSTAPMYWRFNEVAPVRLWALPNGLPPVWKTATIVTSEQVAEFWRDLQKGSTDEEFAEMMLGDVSPPTGDAPEDVARVAKTLRRTISWSATYNLSWYQTEYLRQYIDPATGNTPLEDDDGGEQQLNRLSWVTGAYKSAIVAYFEKARKKHLRDLKKVVARVAKGKKKVGEDAGAVLARRAAEAKEQRERDWEEMLEHVHPGELRSSAAQRIQRIKAKFIQGAGKPSKQWETKIADAIQEDNIVTEKLLHTPQTSILPPMPVTKPVLPAPVATATQEKDLDELIATQGPRVEQEARTKKAKRGKGKETGDSGQTPRRHRFLWNRDYDELVRDASVIIKARCRKGTRLDWGALEQVFPAVPRNSVRQRLVHLKEIPGTETYLARLEDKWHELWVQHRGTDVLPDPDPTSVTNFDLAAHVKFLRKHIDKNAIRVGLVEVKDNPKTVLPASIEDLEGEYEVVEKVPTAPPWDFIWSVVAEEGREKQFAHHAFTAEVGEMPPTSTYESDFLQVADAAVKMALGNLNETYDPEVASQLLKDVGEEPVRAATTELLNRGVLAKIVRDPAKSKPGRTLKISDSNLNALGGTLPREVFQDAAALEELLVQQPEDAYQWRVWPLLASDGDTALLIELASENKVEFDVDTTHPRSMRSVIDWNSKKADDDDIETEIHVRYPGLLGFPPALPPPPDIAASSPDVPVAGQAEEAPASRSMQIDDPPSLALGQEHAHGERADGAPAFCQRTTDGLVDCAACIAEARAALLQDLAPDECAAAEALLAALSDAGAAGLAKPQILMQERIGAFPEGVVRSVVARVADAAAAVPLAHWVGYAEVVLVSTAHVRPWAVAVADPDAGAELEVGGEAGSAVAKQRTKTLVFPRRWLDIYGRKLPEVWDAALRAVLGLVLLRPGISQAEIRWRLRVAYDRAEVGEVLQTLQEEGYLTSRGGGGSLRSGLGGIGPADDGEERASFWFLTGAGRRWYQV
ncbi:hypothetical protein BD413DRAFT_563329 [Trametes elegans]|nr:hypothetical protein BD413DRAFT_563329 [Trametes elegans]